jgi:hypothetical protein
MENQAFAVLTLLNNIENVYEYNIIPQAVKAIKNRGIVLIRSLNMSLKIK